MYLPDLPRGSDCQSNFTLNPPIHPSILWVRTYLDASTHPFWILAPYYMHSLHLNIACPCSFASTFSTRNACCLHLDVTFAEVAAPSFCRSCSFFSRIVILHALFCYTDSSSSDGREARCGWTIAIPRSCRSSLRLKLVPFFQSGFTCFQSTIYCMLRCLQYCVWRFEQYIATSLSRLSTLPFLEL